MKITIYKIENIINGWCYIGSTNNYNSRKKQHLYLLKNNKHHCMLLQQEYNNKSNFIFSLLEQVDERYRYISEEWYITLNINKVYNTQLTPSKNIDSPKRTWELKDMKNLLLDLIKNPTAYVNDILIYHNITKSIFYNTCISRISNQNIIDKELDSLIDQYMHYNRKVNQLDTITSGLFFRNPKGLIIEVTNGLGNFAKEYNLDISSLSRLKNKHRKQHKGWTLYE